MRAVVRGSGAGMAFSVLSPSRLSAPWRAWPAKALRTAFSAKRDAAGLERKAQRVPEG